MNFPLNNVNPSHANIDGSNYAEYNSTANSRAYGLSGQISNIAAANASKGGSRRKRRRIRKSKKGYRKSYKKSSRKNRTRRRYRGGNPFSAINPYKLIQKGGLSSVTNINHGYSVGPPTQLTWNQSALANPGPYSQNLPPGKELNVI